MLLCNFYVFRLKITRLKGSYCHLLYNCLLLWWIYLFHSLTQNMWFRKVVTMAGFKCACKCNDWCKERILKRSVIFSYVLPALLICVAVCLYKEKILKFYWTLQSSIKVKDRVFSLLRKKARENIHSFSSKYHNIP